MEVQVDYYKLTEEKEMGDGNKIPQGQDLILIKKDSNDGMLFLETYGEEAKRLFWVNDDEVEFVDSITEDWEEEKINERNNYINGEFL